MQRPHRHACLLVLLASTSTLSCAEEREPINRVQPNALSKSFFVGEALDDPSDDPEFYMRNTVIDVAAGSGADGLFTSSDAQPTARIRFEVTEQLLVARLTYELVENTDGKGVRRTPDGQIVAAFAIQSHFDIRRDYNETTGEETNVIVENTGDRPWNERTYFRVDWSRNLVTDAYDLDSLSQLGIYYGVTWDPVAYYVNDPSNPDHPVFDLDRGYFDITHKALASPEVLEDEWGQYPACWLIGSFPTLNCNPSEVTLRQAFLRVEDHDYEPLEIDGTMMDMFGYFTWDRFGYDRRYGVIDDDWRRFATRWNLYQQSHVDPPIACNTEETTPIGTDPHRDDDLDGTEDECADAGAGSRCDAAVGECTLPLRERAIRTIPWHVNKEFPADLFEGTAEALEEWNHAIRVAVLTGRLAECRRTKADGCEAQMGWPARWSDDYDPPKGNESLDQVPDIFVLCHNPVNEEDNEACGAVGTEPRLGDLRYNQMTIVDDVEFMSPWGIMMDAEDVLTGEKVAGSVNQWAYVLDRNASNLVDILALLNGEIAADEFLTGENVSTWVEANRPGGSAERYTDMKRSEVESRMRSFDPDVMTPYFSNIAQPNPRLPPRAKHSQRLENLIESNRLGPGNTELSARLAALRGTDVEAMMATPEMIQQVGYDPTAPATPEAIGRGSPFGKMNPTMRRADRRQKRMAQVGRHSCRMDASEPEYLLGMARRAQELFPAPDPSDLEAVHQHRQDVYDWARKETSKGVMAHEIGHSMGLRHNFAASFDSLNYDKRYWQLRTNNGAVTADCEVGETDGSSCIGPRYNDPITDTEIEGNLGRYSTTSTMDYPGDQNQDMLTAGTYDRAALRFGYGGVVDVWAEDGVSVTGGGSGQSKAYELTAFTVSPGLFGVYYFPPVDVADPYIFRHYSTYEREYGILGECSDSDDPDAVLGQACNGAPMDVVDYRDMSDFATDPDYAKFSFGVTAKAVDPDGRVRRGYMFSSDEYADSGNVPSFSDDAGADAYEQIAFLESAFENRYIFDSFRRNRVQFNSADVTSRVQYRYLDNLQLISKAFFFGAVLDGDPTLPTEEFLADGNFGPLAVGSSVAFDMFARILTRPDPGYYCPAEFCGGVQPWSIDEEVYVADWAPLPEVYLYDFSVGLGDGRYLHNDYDYSQGYFWGDYQSQVGAYYDKVWAVYYLGEAFDSFISNSKEDFVDSRYKNVNFATVYPEQMRRLFANLMTGDYRTYAPWATPPSNPDDTPAITLEYPVWHEPTDLGARPAGALLVDPNYGWNTQINAMVWGAMFFPTNWSSQWVHDARIAYAVDEPTWPEAETYRFFDPRTGLTYRAHAAGTEELLGQTVQRGTAARILEWANHLLATAYLVERDGVTDEPILNADGTPQLILDNGVAQLNPETPGADAEYTRFVDSIDLYRQLIGTFEQPLDELPEP